MLSKILTVIFFFVFIGSSSAGNGLKDPTKPAFSAATKPSVLDVGEQNTAPKWVLNSITINGTKRSAIINQKNYRVGDLVGTQRLQRILPNQVTFSSGKILNLFDDSFVSLSIKD